MVALSACSLPLDRAACPCAEGWVCCASEQVCVADGAQCPDDRPPAVEPQRISLDQPWRNDYFGTSVAFMGNLAAAGMPGGDQAASEGGTAIVFERRGSDTGVWVRTAVLTAPDPEDYAAFGTAVAFVGPDVLLVGAPTAGVDQTGQVYIYRRGAEGWRWHETLAPDLTGLSPVDRQRFRFGRSLAADGTRFIVAATQNTAEIYDVTTTGTRRVAQLTTDVSAASLFTSSVALHGSLALICETFSRTVYVFDEARGWAGTAVATLGPGLAVPNSVALDDRRVALPGPLGTVRIVERAGAGWGAPVDVALPVEAPTASASIAPLAEPPVARVVLAPLAEPPTVRVDLAPLAEPPAWLPVALAWHGDDLVLTAWLAGGDVLGLTRLRAAGGTWQPDPIHRLPVDGALKTSLAISGDRALVGMPYAGGVREGAATTFRIDAPGYVEESAITLDDRETIQAIAAGGRHLLTEGRGERVAWFARTSDGRYQERPALVVERGGRLGASIAISGDHALATLLDPTGRALGAQAFTLGAHDWVAGTFLAPPVDGLESFPSLAPGAIAIDGDTAVIGAAASTVDAAAFVYTFRGAAWQLTATLPGLGCHPATAVAGDRIAVFCAGTPLRVRLFQRTGDTWAEMPSPVLPEPSTTLFRILLSGDRLAMVTAGFADVVSDVFRWTGGTWRNELHVRTPDGANGIAALVGDRLVMYRSPLAVTPYRVIAGAWTEQSALALPSRPRSPDARIGDVFLTDDHVVISVPADDGASDRPQGAIYVLLSP